ncbi:hypothetical protein DFH11DRAFT_1688502 [Phellopilus nigrolimitatus]|nr:hypothetical protein DFH11DRAFT_1688502 [Phellopilus nigrolimitatus]
MLRAGEKRAMPAEGAAGASGAAGAGASAGPAQKKAREKMPDFDWSADNYALTWRLVDELRKPENKSVLFPDQEGLVIKVRSRPVCGAPTLPGAMLIDVERMRSGDTKEDVYRRVAKVVHPEAFAHDPQTAGSRMKNKNVAMWKEYSGYCRRLQDLCTTHQVMVPVSGPDEGCPPEIHAEWRKIAISMPVFSVLRTFMPVRPEEKPKAPTGKTHPPRGASLSYPHTPLEDDHLGEHPGSASYAGPVPSPSMHRAAAAHDMPVGGVEGQGAINAQGIHGPFQTLFLSSPSIVTLHEYLELRRSYQEDVRLGIFTPAEAKSRIEALDRHRAQLESTRVNQVASVPHATPSPASSSATAFGQPIQPQAQLTAPDPMLEPIYEEKAVLLGFRKPLPPHPLSRLSFKELFRSILSHAAECDLQECRLDNRRKLPSLGFIQAAHPHELGMPVEIVIVTRAGTVPLAHHAPAACARFASRSTILAMELPLVIHASNGWETTIWDHAHATVAASLRRALSVDEIKTVQAQALAISADPGFRQQFQLLNEASTFFDVLRTGLLYGNSWEPGNAAMGPIDDGMGHVQH